MRLFFSILAGSALVLSACTPFGETSIDECTGEMPEIIAYAKDGTPIYSEVLGIIIVAPRTTPITVEIMAAEAATIA